MTRVILTIYKDGGVLNLSTNEKGEIVIVEGYPISELDEDVITAKFEEIVDIIEED